MIEILEKLANTPLSLIFILAGIFFLLVSVANKLGAKVDINPKRQGQAVIIGVLFVILGLVLYMQTPESGQPTQYNESNQKENVCELSVYSLRDKNITRNTEVCQIHISRGGYWSEQEAEAGVQDTRFTVTMNGERLSPVSNVKFVQTGKEWHVEQFFKTRSLQQGNEYHFEGSTTTVDGRPVDSAQFTVSIE